MYRPAESPSARAMQPLYRSPKPPAPRDRSPHVRHSPSPNPANLSMIVIENSARVSRSPQIPARIPKSRLHHAVEKIPAAVNLPIPIPANARRRVHSARASAPPSTGKRDLVFLLPHRKNRDLGMAGSRQRQPRAEAILRPSYWSWRAPSVHQRQCESKQSASARQHSDESRCSRIA